MRDAIAELCATATYLFLASWLVEWCGLGDVATGLRLAACGIGVASIIAAIAWGVWALGRGLWRLGRRVAQ